MHSNYTVLSDGRIFSERRKIFLKLWVDPKGYSHIRLQNKTYKVHRLVAQKFIPNPLGLPDINHRNGLRSDNRAENLEWSNQLLNMQDAVRRGTHQSQKTRKLSLEHRIKIKELESLGATAISRQLGLSYHAVREFLRGRNYKNG